MQEAVLYISIALGISTVINIVLKHYGISQIIGYILTGTIISHAFGLAGNAHSALLDQIGEFGIVFLMFTIGLEISLAKMNSMKLFIFGNGFMQVGFTSLVIFAITYYLFHLDYMSSLIIALSFSMSSTAVVLTYLKNSKNIYTSYGQRSTGILIFQDIAVIPILILIGILTNEGGEDIYTILFHTFVSAAIVLFLLLVVGKKVISWLLQFSATSELDELFMGSVLFVVTGASLIAHYLGFTYSLGAFVAGMVIAETKYHYKVEADIAPFKDMLLGTFFIVVGMKINISLFIDNISLIFAIFAMVLLLKTLITFIVIRITSTNSISFKTALSISQVGEFSFVIFAIASMGGIIKDELSQLLVLVVILSMVLTPFFISKVRSISRMFFKENMSVPEVSNLPNRKDHIIVCGYGSVGKYVSQQLNEYGTNYIVVDNNPKNVKRAVKDGMEAYLGDMSKRSILEAIHVKECAIIIVTLDNVEKKRLICEAIVKQTNDANIIVKVVSAEEGYKLEKLNISMIVDSKVEVARVLVERVMTCQLKI
ncbi:cation:proton antiporter [Sulfurimonas sp. HSL-1716]|uniref:cation:proton antiporter domain-containing protein n=1 Tax=Hydrocurvibacter sulfurireducens TaxID=3131937 RepID=UPI0031FA1AE8